MIKIIGIDLGYSKSCMSVVEDEKVLVIPNDRGENTIPSMVGISDDERFISGYEAEELLTNGSSRVVSSVLSVIEKNEKIKINGEKFISQQITAAFIRDQ